MTPPTHTQSHSFDFSFSFPIVWLLYVYNQLKQRERENVSAPSALVTKAGSGEEGCHAINSSAVILSHRLALSPLYTTNICLLCFLDSGAAALSALCAE